MATAFTALFIATAFAPLASASTEATPNGDVVINGAFADGNAIGHHAKLYCDAYNPTPLAGPGGECAHANDFVAYDWTAPVQYAANISFPATGGVLVPFVAGETHFIQQHFNGSEAPDRLMTVFKVAITGSASGGSSASLRVELRADVNGDGAVESYAKRITLLTTETTTTLSATDLGIPPGSSDYKLRSIRLWAEGPADAHLTRVSVYATNGVEGRNILLLPAGDDVVSDLDGVGLLNAGDDGMYSFTVGIARDNGEFLPTLDAWLCAFSAQQTLADQGFPTNTPDQMCVDSLFDPESARIVKTREGAAWRVDVPADMIRVEDDIGAISFYAHVKVDGSYRQPAQTSAEFKSGYFTLARMAAAAAGAGVSQENPIATPIFIDADANGKPDYAQTQEMDGYSVIITPLLSTETPLATVMTTDVNGEFLFDVQVYRYDAEGGAPMEIPRGISLGLFDAGSAVANSSPNAPFWRTDDHGHNLERIDTKTWRVHVPASYVEGHPVAGVWAFYNVGNGQVGNVFGRSTSSTDFYSSIRNAVKATPAADAMRSAMTPIVFDETSITRDAVIVVKPDAEVDTLTALDGTLVVDDNGDGSVTFEYAMMFPESRVRVPGGDSHAIALYDAASLASDRFQPGPAGMEHALWVGQGVAQPDGWFRADIPTDAFASAKGATGVWAYVNDEHPTGYVLSRSGWYNALKPAVAAISTSAANASLYEPTPIVVVDHALGLPQGLASALAGVGTDLVGLHNPLVNPGFEAEMFVEGANDRNDNTGGAMTAPPWFLRLDDKGTGQPTNPRSTHTVAYGKGRLNDNALKVTFAAQDRAKTLMLGQILGSENGGDAYVWHGATGASFDVYPIGSADITFRPTVRYLDAEGNLGISNGRVVETSDGAWKRLSVDFAPALPADARLLGFYLVIDATSGTNFYLDNIVVEGAKAALGETRSDISDGYAVVIMPQELSGARQGLVSGTDGDYYLYDVQVVDFTQGAPTALDVSELPKAFSLRTQDLQKGGGEILTLRDSTTGFAAAIRAGDEPAALAVPWAFVGTGETYATLDGLAVTQPASGHYNPMKNALRALPLADQLDYAATPVQFRGEVTADGVSQQALRVVPIGGAYGVVVESASAFVEETTVTVSRPGGDDANYPVTLDSDDGDLVPGLVLTAEDLQVVTIESADTRFTRGAQIVAGSPIASFEVCRPAQPTCLDVGILSNEELTFRSTSVSPTGEPLTLVWTFGDGAVSTELDETTTHKYTRPSGAEPITVNLTVQTPSGKRAYAEKDLVINNRAPNVQSTELTPAAGSIYTDSTPRIRVFASDPDGGRLAYAWTIDELAVTGVTSNSLTITSAILDATLGETQLEKREYVVGVTITDGQNGVTTVTVPFTVGDRPATLSAPVFDVLEFGGDYALAGDELGVSVSFVDTDSAPAYIVLDYATPEHGPLQLGLNDGGEGVWTGSFPVGVLVGDVLATATAYAADDSVLATSPAASFEVRENTPPTIAITGPSMTELGETANFTVSAVDPDGRGLGAIELSGADVTPLGEGEFAVVFDEVGTITLTASVSDVNGGDATTTYDVVVDDAITVTMEVVSAPTTGTQAYLVRITVTDANGDGIGGAAVTVEDFYSLVPQPVETQDVETDPDGSVVVRLRPEAVVVGMPLTRTIVATASAGSLPEAPVQDEETAEATLLLRNTSGPLGGLPLP